MPDGTRDAVDTRLLGLPARQHRPRCALVARGEGRRRRRAGPPLDLCRRRFRQLRPLPLESSSAPPEVEPADEPADSACGGSEGRVVGGHTPAEGGAEGSRGRKTCSGSSYSGFKIMKHSIVTRSSDQQSSRTKMKSSPPPSPPALQRDPALIEAHQSLPRAPQVSAYGSPYGSVYPHPPKSVSEFGFANAT